MRIGIIGSGQMGAGLGRLWAKHGHDVMFTYSRRPERLQDLVQEIGSHARLGIPEEAVRFGDILLLAVPWTGIRDALARSFVVIYAGADSASADEKVLAADFVAHLPYSRYPVRGRENFETQMKDFRSAFSHFQCDIDEVIDDGMRVGVRWTWRGTHSGELLGIAPTHRKIEFSETHLLRISGGRIAEDHVSANLLDLLHQLGATQFAAA